MVMILTCFNCGYVTEIDEVMRNQILSKLKRPADSYRVECPQCHRYQFELAAREIK